MEKSELIFISGGARSGKSTFAEQTAIKLAEKEGCSLHYIATGRPSDEEMKKRIRRHQEERKESGAHWETWECPSRLGSIVSRFGPGDVVLVDCLTILLANELFSDHKTEILRSIDELKKRCRALIVVSNEVLNEPLKEDRFVLEYARLLGHLHQELVRRATEAYLVEAGVPVLMKGKQP